MARSDGDLVSIERSLGLKSDRGISRQGNKDNPVIQDLLSDIKSIAEQYVSKPNTEIRSSPALEQASLNLFSRYGPILWPGPGCERPNWLESPSLERYDGRYPKELHHSDAEDRQTLAELFHDLVVEKCVKYHDNQLQKARRIARRSEHDPADHEHEDHFAHSQQATPLLGPETSDLEKASHLGLSPANPRVPHGLPFTEGANQHAEDDDDDATTPEDGPNSRTKTQRLQDYRNEMARMDESFVLVASDLSRAGTKRRRTDESRTASKRVRGDDQEVTTSRASLIVQPQVNSESIEHERPSGSVEQQATVAAVATHSDSDDQRKPVIANGIDSRGPTTKPTSPSPRDSLVASGATKSSRSEPSPPPRRPSGFQAINVLGDTTQDKASNGIQRGPPDASQRMSSDSIEGNRPTLPPLSQRESPPGGTSTLPRPRSPLTIIPVSQEHNGTSRRSSIAEKSQVSGPTEWIQQGPVRHTIPVDSARPTAVSSPDPGAVSPRTVPRPHSSLNGPPARILSSQRPHHLHSSPATQTYHFPSSSQNPGHPHTQSQSQSQAYPQRPSPYTGLSQRHPSGRTAPSPYSSPRSHHGRRQSLADDILGDLVKAPVVAQLMAANTDLDAQQLRNLKDKLTKFPEARVDINILLARMSAPDPPKTSSPHLVQSTPAPAAPPGWRPGPTGPTPTPTPISRSAQAHTGLNGSAQMAPPLPHPKPHEYPPLPGNPLPNVSVELNWGRQLDFSDFMEMRDCDTTKELFALIDAHVPDEILRLGKSIKEVRVKALKDLHGGNLLPRIVRDESRGRAAIRQLVKRLKAQPAGSEAELMFMVVWDDGR